MTPWGLWVEDPAWCGLLRAFGPQGSTPRAGTPGKQMTDFKADYGL